MRISKDRKLDMTEGKALGLLLSFSVPILIGNIFQVLYNMVDSVIVGRFVSAEALAAVGTCGSPYNLFVNLNLGTATGAGILVAQYFGAHRENMIRPLVTNAVFIMFFTSVVISGAGYLFTPQFLRLLDTPDNVLADAVTYLRIIFLSMMGSAVYNVTSGVLRALGDSKTPLYFLIFSSILNTVLDVVFVTVFHMEVLGVALATLISQYIVAVVTFFYARARYECFRFGLRDMKPDFSLIRKLLSAGVPLALQSSSISLSAMFMQRYVNSFGSVVMAGHTAASRFNNICNMPLNSFGMALSTFVGQNIGAKKPARIREGVKIFWIFSVVFSILIFIAGFTLDAPFIRLFTDDETVVSIGCIATRIYAAYVIFLANIYVNRSVINGSGDTRYSMYGGFLEILGRVGFLVLYIDLFKIGMRGLWYANISNWFITGVFFLIRFLSGKWKEKAFT